MLSGMARVCAKWNSIFGYYAEEKKFAKHIIFGYMQVGEIVSVIDKNKGKILNTKWEIICNKKGNKRSKNRLKSIKT